MTINFNIQNRKNILLFHKKKHKYTDGENERLKIIINARTKKEALYIKSYFKQ